MAASKATGGDFFRHHRDGYKAIHVIRRSNQYGQYLEVSEFHSGSRKGVIRIPAGLEQQGWAQFSLFCKGHQKQATLPQRQNTNDRRREVARAAGTNKAIEGGKPQIMHQDIIFQKHVTDPGNKAMGLISVDMPKNMVNSRVQLSLELELGCGPDGTWVITRAELQNSKPTRTHLTKTISLPKGPITRPVSQSVWRPKTQPVKITHQTPQPRRLRLLKLPHRPSALTRSLARQPRRLETSPPSRPFPMTLSVKWTPGLIKYGTGRR
jgi:hypothetical protein